MKKKILFVITKSTWGGAGRYVFDLAEALKEEYEVAVALGGTGILFNKLEAAGIRTIPIPSLERDIAGRKDAAAFFELMHILKKEKPDIVHLNSSKAGGLGALAARLSRIPRVIYTAHGWAFNEPVPSSARFFRWVASLATLLLSDRVITVSDFDKIHSPLGLEACTVHNGISQPDFLTAEDSRAYIVEKYGVPREEFFIGTIAELTRNKGVDILIEALSRTGKGYLIIFGDGEDRKMLERFADAHGVKERTRFAGFVTDAGRYMKGFDLFALASRKEGLPYVILEAGYAGTPVVATTVGGIPEIIEDGISGALVPPYDAPAFAEALHELIESPNTRAQYAERLKEKVSRYFNLRGMLKKTIEVYEG